MPHELSAIYEEIEKAKLLSLTPEKPVHLIAVSKNFPQEAILPLLAAGHRHFGENRVQEATEKYRPLKQLYPDLVLHLIGPLQSNKVGDAVSLFDVIHTIDREKIARMVHEESLKQNKKISCFLQINIGKEPQKAGIDPSQAKTFLDYCQNCYSFPIKGFMAIPPVEENPGPYFAYMQKLKEACQVDSLSMGMSNDFETAIAFGADYVRIGTKLFGCRNKTNPPLQKNCA